jgi:hypothetical protein
MNTALKLTPDPVLKSNGTGFPTVRATITAATSLSDRAPTLIRITCTTSDMDKDVSFDHMLPAATQRDVDAAPLLVGREIEGDFDDLRPFEADNARESNAPNGSFKMWYARCARFRPGDANSNGVVLFYFTPKNTVEQIRISYSFTKEAEVNRLRDAMLTTFEQPESFPKFFAAQKQIADFIESGKSRPGDRPSYSEANFDRWLAVATLERNPTNRGLVPTQVHLICTALSEGRFTFPDTPISFLIDGSLGQGQHRCSGVLITGIPMKTLVAANFTTEDMRHFDTHAQRRIKSSLEVISANQTHYNVVRPGDVDMRRLPPACDITRIARKVVCLENNTPSSPNSFDVFHVVLDVYNDSYAWIHHYTKLRRGSSTTRDAYAHLRSATVMAVFLIAHKKYPEEVSALMHQVAEHAGLTPGTAAHTLHGYIESLTKKTKATDADQLVQMKKMLTCIVFHVEGNPLDMKTLNKLDKGDKNAYSDHAQTFQTLTESGGTFIPGYGGAKFARVVKGAPRK